MLRQTSLGSVGLVIGGILTVIGFTAYFTDNATLNLVGFFYGIPLLLGGFALKAAELKPAPILPPTPPEILTLREQQATPTQNQVRKDVTRYRYGQDTHLETALEHLGLSPSDDECPILTYISEANSDGHYTLVLNFDSPLVPFETWQQKQEKMQTFFGPGVRVEVGQMGDEEVMVRLITDSAIAPTPSSSEPS